MSAKKVMTKQLWHHANIQKKPAYKKWQTS